MSSHERNNGGLSPDEYGFEWADDDEFSPEAEELLKELSVPVGRPPRQMAEMVHNELAQETQTRLEELRVDGYREVDKDWVKATPELQMTPNILDDVHYVVYRERKKQPYSRFVSISAKEVFRELYRMNENRISGSLLQSEQNTQAFGFLAIDLKMDETSIYRAMAKGPDGTLAVRSLHRLLREESMEEFCKIISRVVERRADEAPMTFEEVANSAVKFIGLKQNRIVNIDTTVLSVDQQTSHLLEVRDVERSAAFSRPVAEFLGRNIEPEQGS